MFSDFAIAFINLCKLLCRKKNIKLKPTFIPTDKLLADKLSRLSGANSIFDIL